MPTPLHRSLAARIFRRRKASQVILLTLILLALGVAVYVDGPTHPNSHPNSQASWLPRSGPLANPRSSGYGGSVADWQGFLDCWRVARVATHRAAGPERESWEQSLDNSLVGDYPDPRATPGGSPPLTQGERDAMLESLHRAEMRLGVTLPKSYVDFMQAYRSDQRARFRPNHSPNQAREVGFVSADQLQRLAEVDPELVKTYMSFPMDSSADAYLTYGRDQDDGVGRTAYLPHLIFVGRYGDTASWEIITLNPQVVTADGEWEAGIRFHSGQFRAPSFAELMRQLNHWETADARPTGRFPQNQPAPGCARLLPMQGVWWR